MTNTQPAGPAAPAAPSAAPAENLADQLDAVNRATEEAARRAEARAAAGGRAPMGVVRDAGGRIVVTGRDGRSIVIDPRVVTDEDAVQHMVETALEPPRFPEPPRTGPSDAFLVTSVVMSTLLLLLLGFPLVRAYVRRQGAAPPAGTSPEVAARLARIEQAIEAVAIEVERISESERYSARLLTERLPERLPERLEEPATAVAPAATR